MGILYEGFYETWKPDCPAAACLFGAAVVPGVFMALAAAVYGWAWAEELREPMRPPVRRKA